MGGEIRFTIDDYEFVFANSYFTLRIFIGHGDFRAALRSMILTGRSGSIDGEVEGNLVLHVYAPMAEGENIMVGFSFSSDDSVRWADHTMSKAEALKKLHPSEAPPK